MSGTRKKTAPCKPPAGRTTEAPGRPESWRRKLAHDLWVVHQASEREACAACGISRGTLHAWRKELDWDEKRRQWAQGWGVVAPALHGKLQALADELERAGAADLEQVIEINKAVRHCLDNVALVRAIERDVDFKRLALRWIRGLAGYLKARDVEALRMLLPHLKAYGKEIALG